MRRVLSGCGPLRSYPQAAAATAAWRAKANCSSAALLISGDPSYTIYGRREASPANELITRSGLVKIGAEADMDPFLAAVRELRCEAPLPRMVRVRQRFDAPVLDDVSAAVKTQLSALE